MSTTTTRVRTYKPVLIKKGQDAARKIGMRFGGYVRSIAKNSIRKGKSSPGGPIADKTGAFKRFIRFEYDPSTRMVYIGPELLPGKTKGAPKALEDGGSVVASVLPDGPQPKGTRSRRVRKRVSISAHPTMALALKKGLPELPNMWRGAIRS